MRLEILNMLAASDRLDEVIERLPKPEGGGLGNALSLVFGVIGAASVIMVIYSGIQMTASAGDAAAVTKARNTLIYSIIGLILAISAYAIVNIVMNKIG